MRMPHRSRQVSFEPPVLRSTLQYGLNQQRVRQVAAMMRRQGESLVERTMPLWGRTTILADGTYIY